MLDELDSDIVYSDRLDLANPDIARGISSITTYPASYWMLPWVDCVFKTLQAMERDNVSAFELEPEEILDRYGGREEIKIFDKIKNHRWSNYESRAESLRWNTPLNIFLKHNNARAHYVEFGGPHKGHFSRLIDANPQGNFSYVYAYFRDSEPKTLRVPAESGYTSFDVARSIDITKSEFNVGYCHMVAHWILAFPEQCEKLLTYIADKMTYSGSVFLSFPDYNSLRMESDFSHDEGWMELIEYIPSTDPLLPNMFKTKINNQEYLDPQVDLEKILTQIKAKGLKVVSYIATDYLRARGCDGLLPHLKSLRVLEISRDILPLTPMESRSKIRKSVFHITKNPTPQESFSQKLRVDIF